VTVVHNAKGPAKIELSAIKVFRKFRKFFP
jgi:hypothetical protein